MTRRRHESCGALLGREPHAFPEGDEIPLLPRAAATDSGRGTNGKTNRPWFQPGDVQSSRPHRRCPAVRLLEQAAHVTKLAPSISRYRVADVPAAPPPPDSLLPLSPVPLRLMRTEETQAPDPGL